MIPIFTANRLGCGVDWLVSLTISAAMFLSISTYLRVFTGGLIGPGEILLAGIALIGLFIGNVKKSLTNPILWFWGLLFFTMFLGALVGKLAGHWVQRNTYAYIYTCYVVLGLAFLLPELSNALLRRLIITIASLASLAMWLGFFVYISDDKLLMNLFFLNDMGDLRYTGWSDNPNQLALYFIPLPVWVAALWTKENHSNIIRKFCSGLLLLSLMLMGLLVRSDALFVVWLFEFAVLLLLRLRWDRKTSVSSLVAYGIAMLFCVFFVKTFAQGEIRKSVRCAVQNLTHSIGTLTNECDYYSTPGQIPLRIGYSDPVEKSNTRVDLWKNGLKAWRKSPVFGHGPGAFSWYSDQHYQRLMETVGKVREEAHNITIDLMTQGGVFLGVAWISLLLYLLVGAWRIRDSYTFSVILMLGVFTMFHYHLRQPYLWFSLLLSQEAIRRRLFVGHAH